MVESIKILNKVTNKNLDLDKLTTPFYILDVCSWGQITGTHNSTSYPNQIGVDIVSTTLGTRPISITGWIIADTEQEMDERKDYLNHLVNPLQEVRLFYKGYAIDFKPDTTIKYSTTSSENNEVIAKFAIDGTAANPLFFDSKKTIAKALNERPYFHFPLVIPEDEGIIVGIKETIPVITVNNKGAVATGMKIILEAKGGDVVNPTLRSANTQKEFKLNTCLRNGQRIEIDTNIGQRSIISFYNGVEENYHRYKDFDSSWLQLQLGENFFGISVDDSSVIENLQVSIEFTNKYLEVEGCY